VIHIIPILNDNYCYIFEGAGKSCFIIDPGEASPVDAYIRKNGLLPAGILNTHHHGDHTGGNADLVKTFDIPVTVPEREFTRIQTATGSVREGDIIDVFGISLSVIETPGHTKGHIVFYCAEENALFSGDTLFSLGCGRVLEGTMTEMFQSLQKIKNLPPETRIYCGHEYTLSNGKFALSVDAQNAELQIRINEAQKLRDSGRPTLPVTLESELKTNPFLRAKFVEEFTALRRAKDSYQ